MIFFFRYFSSVHMWLFLVLVGLSNRIKNGYFWCTIGTKKIDSIFGTDGLKQPTLKYLFLCWLFKMNGIKNEHLFFLSVEIIDHHLKKLDCYYKLFSTSDCNTQLASCSPIFKDDRCSRIWSGWNISPDVSHFYTTTNRHRSNGS
jgi:hypothetical protein